MDALRPMMVVPAWQTSKITKVVKGLPTCPDGRCAVQGALCCWFASRLKALKARIDMATVVLLGTLDTKGDEYAFLRERIREQGCDVVMVDVGVLGEPRIPAGVSRAEVARAVGSSIEQLIAAGDRGAAMETMAKGAAVIARQLYDAGRLDGIIAMGGSGGSSVATYAMRALPIGVPKLMVSTLASGDTRPYVGESDLAMVSSVVAI